MENKEKIKELLQVDQGFLQLLKQVRKEENVLLEHLSEGLMTVSQLARIEKGQRPISKNMRDRILGRLGIASDLYENLLNIEDYKVWEQQRDILCAIEGKEIQQAQELIAAYEKQVFEPGRDKIEQQFCFTMRAEVLKQQNADPQEIGAYYEKAVKLTVPDVVNIHMKEKLLCIQEINLILEYEFYHKDEDFSEKCKELMAFVENSMYDDLSKVKIYPKIVYYYLQEVLEGQGKQSAVDLSESLKIYNRAIAMLRDTGRAYFLLELLEMGSNIMEYIERDSKDNEKVQESEESELSLQEITELAALLKKLYNEYEVPVYMQDCTYLYRQRWMFYVGDVLRIRRKMYGLTQKALCEGICSVRTLRRAEKKEVNMQQGVLGTLLRRLGLSKEFQRARLVTNDREVLKLREEMVVLRNNRETQKARELLKQIREKVSDQIPENLQYFIEAEASLDWMEGKITKEEFTAREKNALQCTLKATDLYHIDELYLTEMEMLCIRNRIQAIEGTEKRRDIQFLMRFFEDSEKRNTLPNYISMYEFVSICVVSELGNLGEHQQAIRLGKSVTREDLKCRRIRGIDGYLYEILWNEREQQKKDGYSADKEKMTEDLLQCALLSHFCKQTLDEEFYRNKMR